MASKVLIAGCGDLGSELAKRLSIDGYEVYGLRYSNKPLPDNIQLIQADVTELSSLGKLAEMRPQFLVYCVAANAQTDESYKAHYLDGLRHVLSVLDKTKLQHVFFVSSTRVYGQAGDEILDEFTPAIAADFGGERLLQAEALLHGINGTVLRLSGIYGPGRTRMLQLATSPQAWPAQNTWTNRIHRDDAAAFIAYLIGEYKEPLAPCYIVTDSSPVSQHEVLGWIAKQKGIQFVATEQPVAGGKRLSNQLMLGTGFKLRYPDYQAGYATLMA